ncbi:MAG: NAD(P)H-dependent oxidoreductase subunit E [Armatimonadetes bacterium]|nr:NAD(P)H-dependent oxidoreductase subunit E [Armatimonadota bacterium]
MDLIQLTEKEERPQAPKPGEVELRFSDRGVKELDYLLTHYPDRKSAMLPALWIAQREYGGNLPAEAVAEVAVRLGRSYAEVEGVATFYTMYHIRHAVGKHVIEVCTCIACALCGAYRIADYLKAKLGVDWGETTPDGTFTLEEVECLDACDRAPVLMVADEYIGPAAEKDVDTLIERLRNTEEPTTVRLADEVTQAQLHKTEQASAQD